MQTDSEIVLSKLAHFTGHQSAVFALCGFDETHFLSGSGNGLVVKWDLNEKEQPTAIAKVPANVFSLNYLAETQQLLVGQMNGGLHLLELQQSQELRNLGDGKAAVFDLLRHSGKLYAVTASGELLQWGTEDWSLQNRLRLTDKSLRCIARQPKAEETGTGSKIAIGASDHCIYLLDENGQQLEAKLEGHENSVFCLRWSPDGAYLLSGSRDAHLHVWDGQTGNLVRRIAAHNFTINHIAWHPEGSYFATASRDKTIKIWRAADFALLKVIDHQKDEGHLNSVNKLFWSAYGNSLISCSDDRSIIMWAIDFPPS